MAESTTIEQQAKGGNKSELRYLTPLEIDTKERKKYCRFQRNNIKYIDYKDADGRAIVLEEIQMVRKHNEGYINTRFNKKSGKQIITTKKYC